MSTKASTVIISTVIVFALAVILAIMSAFVQLNTKSKDMGQTEDVSPDAVVADSSIIDQSTAINLEKAESYTIKSHSNTLEVFHTTPDGKSKLIQAVDINPEVLPESDRLALRNGITTDSYEKICSMLEDFSS